MMQELVNLAKEIATEAGLDPALVCAICEQESAWNPWAIRYEPAFQRRYIEPLKLNPTHTVERSISWGLMQVMGQSAIESGYKGQIPQMLSPEVGIRAGCALLKKKLEKAEGDVHKALLLWNGGGRLAYADEVLARIDKYKDGGLSA